MLRKYVFAGTAYSGKTTMLNEMAKLGYHTVPEVARGIIEDQLANGGDILPWIDRRRFDQLCLKTYLENESDFNEGIIFFDRALPDCLAYHKMYGTIPECLEHVSNSHYDKVFLLEMLPGYVIDMVRKYDIEIEKKMSLLIKESYAPFCDELVHVPVLPLEKRTELVLAKLI